MINSKTLTQEWIDEVAKTHNADKILIEKVIRALLLLEGLVSSGLSFIFKGGTALMLLTDTSKRLSIDIDIIITDSQTDLEKFFNSFFQEQGFERFVKQVRTSKSAIKKVHYKFFYNPIYRTIMGEDAVLLDILFEDNQYQNVSLVEIKSSFVDTSGTLAQVNIPCYEDLLGDKLTAFAPNTSGIPYIKNDESMSMEILKQLYDIGNIFDVVEDLDVIKKTFNNIAQTEIEYRDLKEISILDVLNDIYHTSLCLSLRGLLDKENYEHLQEGIKRVKGFIYSEPYHIEKATSHSAKAAYLSRLILSGQKTIEKYENPSQVTDAFIIQPHNTKLNKLKKSNPEAFFYWWKATQLFDKI